MQNNFAPTNINDLKNSNIQNTTATNYLQNVQDATTDITKCFLDKATYWTKYLENKTKDFYLKNKKYIIPLAIISSYIGVCLTLKAGQYYIEKDDLWSNWQPIKSNNTDLQSRDFTNINLMSQENNSQINQKEIIKLLLIEIQSRYTDYNKPLDILSPLSDFMKNIEKEKNKLTAYLNFYNFLETTRLVKIFPINTSIFLKIKSKLSQLLFIRNIFFTWLYMYKIEKNIALQA